MATTAPALKTAQFGVIGQGNMGENLALNVEGPVHTDWRRLIDDTSRPSQET